MCPRGYARGPHLGAMFRYIGFGRMLRAGVSGAYFGATQVIFRLESSPLI